MTPPRGPWWLLLMLTLAAPWAGAQAPRPVALSLEQVPGNGNQVLVLAAVARIDAGWHVNTDQPSFEFLVPSRLEVEAPTGWQVHAVRYPPPLIRRFAFAGGNRLRVWEGRAEIRVTLVAAAAHAPRTPPPVAVRLRYQACSDRVCLPPATVSARLPAAADASASGTTTAGVRSHTQ